MQDSKPGPKAKGSQLPQQGPQARRRANPSACGSRSCRGPLIPCRSTTPRRQHKPKRRSGFPRFRRTGRIRIASEPFAGRGCDPLVAQGRHGPSHQETKNGCRIQGDPASQQSISQGTFHRMPEQVRYSFGQRLQPEAVQAGQRMVPLSHAIRAPAKKSREGTSRRREPLNPRHASALNKKAIGSARRAPAEVAYNESIPEPWSCAGEEFSSDQVGALPGRRSSFSMSFRLRLQKEGQNRRSSQHAPLMRVAPSGDVPRSGEWRMDAWLGTEVRSVEPGRTMAHRWWAFENVMIANWLAPAGSFGGARRERAPYRLVALCAAAFPGCRRSAAGTRWPVPQSSLSW